MAEDVIVIKKYPNRRLYDTSASRYINLDQVARMIREGRHVQVVDATTGDDITRVVLTQIIVDSSRSDEQGLPVELLRQMVAASDESMQQFLSWYLDTAMEGYRKAREAFEDHVDQVSKVSRAGGAWGPLETMQNAFDPARMLELFAPPSGRPRPAAEEPRAGDDRNAEVEELRRRLAEMERRLEELSKEQADE
jgi:polyhydroxyalkanoate synthesis repressor PhaR